MLIQYLSAHMDVAKNGPHDHHKLLFSIVDCIWLVFSFFITFC